MRLSESVWGIQHLSPGEVSRDWFNHRRKLWPTRTEPVFVQGSADNQAPAYLCANDRLRYLGLHRTGSSGVVAVGHDQQDLRLYDGVLRGKYAWVACEYLGLKPPVVESDKIIPFVCFAADLVWRLWDFLQRRSHMVETTVWESSCASWTVPNNRQSTQVFAADGLESQFREVVVDQSSRGSMDWTERKKRNRYLIYTLSLSLPVCPCNAIEIHRFISNTQHWPNRKRHYTFAARGIYIQITIELSQMEGETISLAVLLLTPITLKTKWVTHPQLKIICEYYFKEQIRSVVIIDDMRL